MRFYRPVSYFTAALAFVPLSTWADMGSYFSFIQPTTGTEWVNDQANPIIWEKGLLDGVSMFDLELARLSQDGLIKAALNVPALQGSLNLHLQDVPSGDDYYLLFINSTHGGMYAISPRFSILASGSSPSNASASASPAVSTAGTVTVSGGPNPTAVFATTFPAVSGGGGLLPWKLGERGRVLVHGLVGAALAVFVGGAWTVLL